MEDATIEMTDQFAVIGDQWAVIGNQGTVIAIKLSKVSVFRFQELTPDT